MALPIIIIGLFVCVLLYWRADRNGARTFGSARFAPVWTLFRNRLFKAEGLWIGEWIRQLSVYYDGPHALTLGTTGSGKGTTAIIPNLLRHRRIFLIDPGGENTAIAIKHWRRQGYALACINPFGMYGDAPHRLPVNGFNPLDVLDPDALSFAADAKVLAEMLTPPAGNEGINGSYFKDSAEHMKAALIIHILTTEEPKFHNLSRLYELVHSDAEGWTSLVENMRYNPVCGGLVHHEANTLARIEEQAPEEFSAIFSTMQQDLNWLADPQVREHMKRSDVDFTVLKNAGQRGAVISVVMPLEYIETHAAITRFAMACTILTMQRRPQARDKLLFLIDEAEALGKITRFPNWLATLRRYNVVIRSIWQNAGQIKQLYRDNWEGLIANCGVVQTLGIADVETAEYCEKALGRTTVTSTTISSRGDRSTSETARPLLTADELTRLKPTKMIVRIVGLDPIVLNKTQYWTQPELRERFHENPYRFEKNKGPGPLTRPPDFVSARLLRAGLPHGAASGGRPNSHGDCRRNGADMAELFLEGLIGGFVLILLLFAWGYSGVLLVHVILLLLFHISLWIGRCLWIGLQFAGDGLALATDAAARRLADAGLFIGILLDELRGPGERDDADEELYDDDAADHTAYDAALTLLGLPDGCTEAALSRAYKSAISRAHPDRGGSAEQAQAVNVARDVIRRVRGWR